MNRWYVIIILFVLVIALATAEHIIICNTTNDLQQKVSKIETSVKQSEQIKEESKIELLDLKDYWEKREPLLCMLVNHKDIDIIGSQIFRIETYLNEDNKTEALAELSTIKFFFSTFEHITKFHFSNIF